MQREQVEDRGQKDERQGQEEEQFWSADVSPHDNPLLRFLLTSRFRRGGRVPTVIVGYEPDAHRRL